MTKIWLSLFALVFSLLPPSSSAKAGETISIPFVAHAGDRFSVRIEKEREDVKNGDVTNHIKVLLKYNGLITRVSEDEMTVEWKQDEFKTTQIAGKQPNFEGDLSALLPALQTKKITFNTDTLGNPRKFHNYDQIKDATLKMIGVDPKNKEAREHLETTLFALDEETAARTFLQEAALIGMGQSIELPGGESQSGKETTPNPLGGVPIELETTIGLKTNDDRQVQFEMISTFVPESVTRSVAKAIEDMSARQNVPIEKLRKITGEMSVQRKDVTVFSVSKTTGWTTQVDQIRTARVAAGHSAQDRTDTWHISVRKIED